MPDQFLDPLSGLSLLVFRSAQCLTANGDRYAAPWGLTSAQWKVMSALSQAGTPLSAAAIGRAMGLSRQAVIKQIHLLAEGGMVEAVPNPANARAPIYDLTVKGCQTHESLMAQWSDHADGLLKEIGEAEVKVATVVLDFLIGRLTEEEWSREPGDADTDTDTDKVGRNMSRRQQSQMPQ